MTRGSFWSVLALAIAAFFWSSLATKASESAILKVLEQRGVHAIMRHALAPGFSDPSEFRLNDCATQRNLNEKGRAQARAIGQALKAAGVVFDQVLTSQWCRCRETATLLDMGLPSDFPSLNSFFEDRSTAERQTEDVRALLRTLRGQKTVMLVTHQVNISALTGRGVASGEVLLIRIEPDDTVSVLGEFLVPPG